MAVLHIFLLSVFITILLVLRRLYTITPHFNSTPPPSRSQATRKQPSPHVLFLLGSGGHTTEMLSLISALSPGAPIKRTYVFSSGDSFSAQKAINFESCLQFDVGTKEPSLKNTPSGGHQLAEKSVAGGAYDLREIPRARKVGQSWLSTPWSCIMCLVGCVRVFTSGDTQPDLVVCNGPGSAVMMVAVCFLFKFFGLCSTRTIYVESFARVSSLSLSGRLLYPFVNRFIVQWPGLKQKYRRAEYHGVLV